MGFLDTFLGRPACDLRRGGAENRAARRRNALQTSVPPHRQIAVVIPELVKSQWYQYLLHNQRATGLKAALLLRGNNRVVVINVPWYLHAERKA